MFEVFLLMVSRCGVVISSRNALVARITQPLFKSLVENRVPVLSLLQGKQLDHRVWV